MLKVPPPSFSNDGVTPPLLVSMDIVVCVSDTDSPVGAVAVCRDGRSSLRLLSPLPVAPSGRHKLSAFPAIPPPEAGSRWDLFRVRKSSLSSRISWKSRATADVATPSPRCSATRRHRPIIPRNWVQLRRSGRRAVGSRASTRASASGRDSTTPEENSWCLLRFVLLCYVSSKGEFKAKRGNLDMVGIDGNEVKNIRKVMLHNPTSASRILVLPDGTGFRTRARRSFGPTLSRIRPFFNPTSHL